MGIHVQYDVCRSVDISRLGFAWYPIEFESYDAIPIAPGTEQHVVIQIAYITTLPETLYVLFATSGTDMLSTEVDAHQVQDPGNRRCTGPVHSQHEYLHVSRLP